MGQVGADVSQDGPRRSRYPPEHRQMEENGRDVASESIQRHHGLSIGRRRRDGPNTATSYARESEW